MKIHREGYSIIVGAAVIAGLLTFVEFRFMNSLYFILPLTVILVLMVTFLVCFFRVPKRQHIPGDKVVTSVADGRIVIKEKVFEDEYFHEERLQVSVYMNFFDVHVNFWPADGEITYYKYHPGKYNLAYLPKASDDNEHSSIVVKTNGGQEIMFRQIAGMFARRVVTYGKPGDKVVKASQCGVIKFGSRIDMFLPLDADIKVDIDDEVKACITIIAELS
ncbi:MAG: phosphatidylserine decarboxylase family protein [Bacteroidales bacterium]|nr:phosphatidylserine decarboxylase family protein [Bacteroidales bacterium]